MPNMMMSDARSGSFIVPEDRIIKVEQEIKTEVLSLQNDCTELYNTITQLSNSIDEYYTSSNTEGELEKIKAKIAANYEDLADISKKAVEATSRISTDSLNHSKELHSEKKYN